MSTVLMYCTTGCPFCQRAEKLLLRRGARLEKIELDGDPEGWAEMERRTGRDTVPQIFIGDRHVGGYDELVELDMDGELEPLLQDQAG